MKYFLDTEFIDNGITVDLVSIGIVSEDDRRLYMQNMGAKFDKAGDWVWRKVFPSLLHFDMSGKRACQEPNVSTSAALTGACSSGCPWAYHWEIRNRVRGFCDPDKYSLPEFWGYYADYDWVAFCQLFGTMMDLPSDYPKFCNDLKQFAGFSGNPKLPKATTNEDHNALSDALEIKMRYEWLIARDTIRQFPVPTSL